MRRYGVTLAVTLGIVLTLLFFFDYFTGRVNHEQQDPYSRIRRVTGQRFGFAFDDIVPNEMSEYYYNDLKQPRAYCWEASPASYAVEKLTGAVKFEDRAVAPVMFLEPQTELEFLRSLPDDRIRLLVIHSLFHARRKETDPSSVAWNQRQMEIERARVQRIVTWYELDRKDFSVSFSEWWRDNAHAFGIHPDGSPASGAAVASGHRVAAQ